MQCHNVTILYRWLSLSLIFPKYTFSVMFSDLKVLCTIFMVRRACCTPRLTSSSVLLSPMPFVASCDMLHTYRAESSPLSLYLSGSTTSYRLSAIILYMYSYPVFLDAVSVPTRGRTYIIIIIISVFRKLMVIWSNDEASWILSFCFYLMYVNECSFLWF